MNGNRLTEYERWQADVGAYTDRLVCAVVASGQYAGAEIRHATREFIIFAVGEPSPPVVAVLQQAPDIVRVTWRQAPHTQAELTSEMRRIMSRFRGQLTSGVARHDGTGIKLTTADAELLEASEPQAVLECRYPVVEDGLLLIIATHFRQMWSDQRAVAITGFRRATCPTRAR